MSVPGSASPLFLATAAAAAPAGFRIDRSLRFNSADSAYLSRTPSSAGNRKTWTWSGWLKRTGTGTTCLFSAQGSSNHTLITFYGSTQKFAIIPQAGQAGATFQSNDLHRDPSAWYHFVIALDTTQSTASNRLKVYKNGVEMTWSSSTYPSQNEEWNINIAGAHNIGRTTQADSYLDGYLTEIHFVDGTALAATDFGEEDSNGVWQPKDCKDDLTYGTNGFYLKFADNSSNAALGTDSSGNSNTFTVNNLDSSNSVSTSAITNVGSTTGTISYSDNNPQAYDPSNLTTFTTGRHSTTQTSIRHVKISDIGTGSILLEHVSGNNFYITGSNTTSNTNSSPLVHSSYNDFTIDSSFGYAYARIYAGGQGQITYDATVTGPTLPVLTTTNNNNYSDLAVGDSNSAGVSITAINSSAPSITVDGGSWSNGDVFTVPKDSDSVFDSPTNYDDGTNVGGNYATLNSISHVGRDCTFSNGNLDVVVGDGFGSTNNDGIRAVSTIGMTSGKWYFEHEITGGSVARSNVGVLQDITTVGFGGNHWIGSRSTDYIVWSYSGQAYNGGSGSSYGVSWTTGDIIGCAFDADNGNLYVYKNGTVMNSGTAAFTGLTSGPYYFVCSEKNSNISANFGQRPFAHPVSGYNALCTQNLDESAYASIADGSTAFDVSKWVGNSSNRSISLGFGPDFVWIKAASNGFNHQLFDIIRGANKRLSSNTYSQEATAANSLTSFNSDGFSLGTDNNGDVNGGGPTTYFAWSWDAGTSTASNTDGSITTNVRASQANGFSVATYQGNGNANQTLGHGLGAAPAFVIIKDRTSSQNWAVLHTSAGTLGTLDGGTNYKLLELSSGDAARDASYNTIWHPTNTTVKIGEGANSAHWTNKSNDNYVMYSWAPVEGFSAFGSYVGTGTTDGPFVFTGHLARFLMIKCATKSGEDWLMLDTKRDTYNDGDSSAMYASQSHGDNSTSTITTDILSNGFKARATNAAINESGQTYVYMSFASHPFRTARAR